LNKEILLKNLNLLKKTKEKKSLELAKEIKRIQERKAKEEKTIEDYQKIIELSNKIKRLFHPFRLEGNLNEKEEEFLLLEYQAGGEVLAANFSPDGEKIVMGGDDNIT